MIDFNQMSNDVQNHIFDTLGYDLRIEYLEPNGVFDHDLQTYQSATTTQTVRGVVLPVPIKAIDGHHITQGDSEIYLDRHARQPEKGSRVFLPHDVVLRVKAVEIIQHNGVIMAYKLVAGAV